METRKWAYDLHKHEVYGILNEAIRLYQENEVERNDKPNTPYLSLEHFIKESWGCKVLPGDHQMLNTSCGMLDAFPMMRAAWEWYQQNAKVMLMNSLSDHLVRPHHDFLEALKVASEYEAYQAQRITTGQINHT